MQSIILSLAIVLCLLPLLARSWKWLGIFSGLVVFTLAGLFAYILYWDQTQGSQNGLGAAVAILFIMLMAGLAVSATLGRSLSLFVQRKYTLARWKVLPIDIGIVAIIGSFAFFAVFGLA